MSKFTDSGRSRERAAKSIAIAPSRSNSRNAGRADIVCADAICAGLFVRMWFAVALRELVQKHCRAASLELAIFVLLTGFWCYATAVVTISDPVGNFQVGNCYLIGGSSASLGKAAGEVLMSNSAASVVGVAIAYTN